VGEDTTLRRVARAELKGPITAATAITNSGRDTRRGIYALIKVQLLALAAFVGGALLTAMPTRSTWPVAVLIITCPLRVWLAVAGEWQPRAQLPTTVRLWGFFRGQRNQAHRP